MANTFPRIEFNFNALIHLYFVMVETSRMSDDILKNISLYISEDDNQD